MQDTYEELVLIVGSRRSGLNQNLALKGQYEQALQDLTDLVDTAQDKMAADQKIIANSVEEVESLLDKHKVGFCAHPGVLILLILTSLRVLNGPVVLFRSFSGGWSLT